MKIGLNNIHFCPDVCGTELHIMRIHIKNVLTFLERNPTT